MNGIVAIGANVVGNWMIYRFAGCEKIIVTPGAGRTEIDMVIACHSPVLHRVAAVACPVYWYVPQTHAFGENIVMAPRTCTRRAFEHRLSMAAFACDFLVPSIQRKAGGEMIEPVDNRPRLTPVPQTESEQQSD